MEEKSTSSGSFDIEKKRKMVQFYLSSHPRKTGEQLKRKFGDSCASVSSVKRWARQIRNGTCFPNNFLNVLACSIGSIID